MTLIGLPPTWPMYSQYGIYTTLCTFDLPFLKNFRSLQFQPPHDMDLCLLRHHPLTDCCPSPPHRWIPLNILITSPSPAKFRAWAKITLFGGWTWPYSRIRGYFSLYLLHHFGCLVLWNVTVPLDPKLISGLGILELASNPTWNYHCLTFNPEGLIMAVATIIYMAYKSRISFVLIRSLH